MKVPFEMPVEIVSLIYDYTASMELYERKKEMHHELAWAIKRYNCKKMMILLRRASFLIW